MKKRFLAMLMAVCMILGLCPVVASASNFEDEVEAYVTSYEELVAALAVPEMERITIAPVDWEGNVFTWPQGEVTLDLNPVNTYCELWLGNGTWTVPSNVTVNAYKTLLLGAPTGMEVIIDGTWNVMGLNSTGGASIGGVGGRDENGELYTYGSVTVNGTMTVSADLWSAEPVGCDDFTLNGTLVTNAQGFNMVGDIVLGDGARITGSDDVRFEGDIVSLGTAYVDNRADFSNDEAVTISGNIVFNNLYQSRGAITVTSGSTITAHTASIADEFYLNGELVLDSAEGGSSTVSSTIHLGENGVIKVLPNVRVNKSGSGCIGGTGTLKVYARISQWGVVMDDPQIFGTWMADGDPEGIAETVTIWRNWEVECDHVWGEEKRVEPTCGSDGYSYKECANGCGLEQWTGNLWATGEHSQITYSQPSNSCIMQKCGVCQREMRLYIACEDQGYTGEALENARLSGEWYGKYPTITYSNNIDVGTGTASFSAGGYTAFCEFEIVDCAGHTGGTATCYQRAKCDLCGGEYGDYAEHTPYEHTSCEDQPFCVNCGEILGEAAGHEYGPEDLVCTEYAHYYVCKVCGWELPEDIISAELGLEPGRSHVYPETDLPCAAVACLVCGYERAGEHWYDGGECIWCGETALISGDVNGNGGIDIFDANMIASYYNEIIELDELQLMAADVNQDGVVNIFDANLIAAYYNEVIDEFPIG